MAGFEVLSCEGLGGLRWQSFYERLPTAFRSIHFSPAYARANAQHPWCAVAEGKGGFVMQPFVTKTDSAGVTMESVYGYGGPIAANVANGGGLRDQLEKEMSGWREQHGIICERTVLHPRLFQHQAILLPAEACPLFRKRVVLVPTIPEKAFMGVENKRRSALAKASRDGITARRALSTTGEPLFRFWQLYDATMERAGAVPIWRYPLAFFERMVVELRDNIALMEAVQNDVVVSSALVLTSPPEAYYQYAGNSGVSGASDLLIMEAAKHAHDCGCDTIDLGGGVTRDPKDPLLWYKSTFSRQRGSVYVVERVYDKERFTEASKGFEGVGYFPPWRAGAILNAVLQGSE